MAITKSEALFKEAVQYIPGGVNSPVRAFGSIGSTPRFIKKADKALMWDEDDNEYIDFIGSWGPMILGHNHPLVLDAVLVMALPQEYKLAGAAAASALSQVVGGGVPLLYFGRKNSSLLRLGRCRPDGKVILQACTNGSSEFMSNIAMSLVSMLYNLQLLHFAGEDGVAAYGVMMYVSMIFSAAFIGYSIGAAPIVSFHFGAQNHGELQSLLRKSLRMIGLFGAAMVLSSQALALPLSKIFVGYDPDLMHMTASGFRIFGLSFLFMGYAIYASGFFTALSDGLTSALIAFLRTMVFQVAAVLLLPKLWELTGIWMSIVVAEFMAVVLSAIFLLLKRKKYSY